MELNVLKYNYIYNKYDNTMILNEDELNISEEQPKQQYKSSYRP